MVSSVFAFFLFLFQIGPAPADSTDASISTLSANKAVEIAYRQNPKIKQLQYQIKAQKSREVLSLGISDPQISYMKEGVGKGNFAEQRWAVSQSFPFPLTGFQNLKQQKAATQSLQHQLRDLENQVKMNVKTVYTELAYAIQSLALAEERVQLFETLRKAAQARADIGEASEIDAMQADLQLQEALNSRETAQKQFMDSRYDLFQSIGLDPEVQTYDIVFPDTLEYVNVRINQDEIMNQLPDHPKLKQIEQEKEVAIFGKKAAKSSYLPDLNFSYYRQDFGNNYDFYGFEVGVSIPLWFAAKQVPKVKQANALQHAVEWKYQDAKLLIKKQAEQSWHSYRSAKTNIDRFRENIQAKSLELVQMTQKGYGLGELDLLTLLEAQRTYLRTQEAYSQTLRDYYLTIIKLERYLQTDLIFN